jgi:hypothetical protein
MHAVIMNLVFKQKKALIGVGVLGAGLLAGGQLIRRIPKEDLPELDTNQNLILKSNAEFYGLMSRLRRYGLLEPEYWAPIIDRVVTIVTLASGAPPGLSIPRKVAYAIDGVIYNIRRLRAIVHRKFGSTEGVLKDFDDIAAGLQEACKNTQFNVTLQFNS